MSLLSLAFEIKLCFLLVLYAIKPRPKRFDFCCMGLSILKFWHFDSVSILLYFSVIHVIFLISGVYNYVHLLL